MSELSKFLRYYTLEGSPIPAVVFLSVMGAIVGILVSGWIARMLQEPRPRMRERIGMGILMGVSYSLVYLAIAHGRCQEIVEGGSLDWYPARIVAHLILLTLMIAATGTDLKRYEIPDAITIPGMILGVTVATLCGNIQILPLWVDWNHPFTQTFGPYIPEWIKQYQHLHGLAWSLAGLIAGGGITWLARFCSRLARGEESMGDGDVTLMAMIGSFLGWQPMLFAFVFAPLWGLLGALISTAFSGKRYIPYGPYLCAGGLTAMLMWRWLWPPVRLIFGHPPTLALLVGGIFAGIVVLMGLMRAYRSIPVR